MEINQILTIIIISVIISFFSYVFWSKSTDKILQSKFLSLKNEFDRTNESISRKIKRIESELQKNRRYNNESSNTNLNRGHKRNVDRNN